VVLLLTDPKIIDIRDDIQHVLKQEPTSMLNCFHKKLMACPEDQKGAFLTGFLTTVVENEEKMSKLLRDLLQYVAKNKKLM
jgi:hypothetical protein